MDIVSGAASVAQLVHYSHVVVQRLVQLYKAAQEGSSFCRTQRSNIGFLLESIQRVCTEEAPDTDSILPLLIATAGLATSLLILLKPKGTLYNYWHWISKGHEIESTFSALNDKTRLLQLHITEKTYSIVTRVQKDMAHMNQSLDTRPSQMDQPLPTSGPATSSISSYDPRAGTTGRNSNSAPDCEPYTNGQGYVKIASSDNEASKRAQQSVASGWGKGSSSADITAHKNMAGTDSRQSIANAEVVPMGPMGERPGASATGQSD